MNIVIVVQYLFVVYMALGIRALFYDERHHTRFVKLFVSRKKDDKKIILFSAMFFFQHQHTHTVVAQTHTHQVVCKKITPGI